ncbi:putative vacuolar protein sorting-associated protein 13A [Phytophthora ramorum]|uniref:putative vacuolar protein sorting-associated protein 13A n=1 Tax=Phytophthora ramorum TaxID=164328 RepID=UPI0030B4B1E2|nr:putative vacuolar protein sorting-associated protein 13A [Phytophthora ramorum]
MFEKVVESVLEEYVSEWVEGLDSEKMKVALFAGKVEFRDLRMRGAALDKFQLPMKMKSGTVGRLSIKVPWKRLTSQAVKIKIEDVFLVVEPTSQGEAGKGGKDDDSYLLRTRWAKQQEVKMLELVETMKSDGAIASGSETEGDVAGAADSDPTASWGYRKKILNTILDNVSFEFSNIHIRYEDSRHLASSIPLALGLTIDSIVISSTNANGQAEFVDRAQARTAFVHRRLEMVQASIYSDNVEVSGAKGRQGPSTSGSNIVHPFSTRINLARNHDQRTAATIPKLRCSAEISAIRACLTPQQSTFLIGMADFVSAHEMYLKRLHFQRKRPNVPIHSGARLWWQYALHGVQELHPSTLAGQKAATTVAGGNSSRKSSAVSRRCNWKLFATLWFARKEYIRLHKNMLRAAKKKKLDVESVLADRARLHQLEDILDVETIVFFRQCATREIEIEGQGHDSPRKLAQWKSKWSSGRTSSGSSSTASSTHRENTLDKLDIYLSVNERMHASSEARTPSSHEERSIAALLMALDLVVISFEVVLVEEYKVGDQSDTRDFLRFELNEFVVTVLQRTSSSTVSSRITSVQILDFRQMYEAASLEKKEPQALLSMIDSDVSSGNITSRKSPFVELNIETSENKFQLDCGFERFRYIHNLIDGGKRSRPTIRWKHRIPHQQTI